jgi:chromosome segregation ATPase
MNFKNNNSLDLTLFKTVEDGYKYIQETQLEVNDITNQINDFTELLEISRKINTELDADPDWIVKAQCARRIKLSHISLVEQWIQNQPQSINNKKDDLNIRLNIIEQQLNSLKKRLDKERQCRANTVDEHRRQIGFALRAIRELYTFLLCIVNKLEIKVPALITQAQLNWVDEVITKNPKAMLLQKDAE